MPSGYYLDHMGRIIELALILIGALSLGLIVGVLGRVAWWAAKERRFGCLFGLHKWTPWWVCLGDGTVEGAQGIQRSCLKCANKQYAAAGYPFDKDGYRKEDWAA